MMKGIGIWVVLCLTLGLAPFGEPHLIGKIQWVMGGAVGMELLDWFDLLLHGFPWMILLIKSFLLVKNKMILKKGFQ